jgi:hypothetical protein
MKTMAIIQTFLALLGVVAVFFYFYRVTFWKHRDQVKLNEPDLKLVNRPDLIGKMPENEEDIPDANAPSWKAPSKKTG